MDGMFKDRQVFCGCVLPRLRGVSRSEAVVRSASSCLFNCVITRLLFLLLRARSRPSPMLHCCSGQVVAFQLRVSTFYLISQGVRCLLMETAALRAPEAPTCPDVCEHGAINHGTHTILLYLFSWISSFMLEASGLRNFCVTPSCQISLFCFFMLL